MKKKIEESFTKFSMEKKVSERRIIEDAVSTMKNEIMFFLDNQHNCFWGIEADMIKDYEHYFLESNAKNLEEKYRRKGKGKKSKKYPTKIDKIVEMK